MRSSDVSRREFHQLAAAAFGGLLAGASVSRHAMAAEAPGKKDPRTLLLLQEPHVCRGLNASCKGEVGGKKNGCAGMTHCATAAHHACNGMNDCAGLGGCGAHPGENKCKGMGSCAVPLEAKVLIERWRCEYKTIRPHSSLGYRPPTQFAPACAASAPAAHAKWTSPPKVGARLVIVRK